VSRNRRLIAGALCVEAVAVAAVVRYGPLSLTAVLLVYWIDLLFLTLRATVQGLLARPVTRRESDVTLVLLPFRLLRHKRGGVSVTDRLPPLYPRNVPRVVGSGFVLVVSTLSTVAVAVVHVPETFWADPATPLVLGAGVLAAATKAWLALQAHVAAGVHETHSGQASTPTKRLLLFTFYAVVLSLTAQATVDVLAENDPATVSTGLGFWAAVLIVCRLAYSVRAARTRFDGDGDADAGVEAAADPPASADEGPAADGLDEEPAAEAGLLARVRARLTEGPETVVPTPPSVPDGEPVVTVRPRRVSVLAAGVVNAVTTGGVVDGKFSDRGLNLRVGVALILGIGLLALLDGAVEVFAVLWGGGLALVAGYSALSALHMTLGVGGVEYRLYDAELVAYDGRLDEPQWAVPYDAIEDVSVDRGLFGSPLWLDAGTVTFERTDGAGDEAPTADPRASIPFVAEPERVRDILESRGRAVTRERTEYGTWSE
jgi:hypothetical protein